MRLTNIRAKNIKGSEFDLPLTQINILLGPNGVGKTAVLNAIYLAILGYVPGYDKTNSGAFDFASGNAMNVCAQTDEGDEVERAWLRSPDGRVSKNERQTSGAFSDLPLAMLDANEYLAKSERARAEMVFAVMRLEDSPLPMRIEDVKARLGGNTRALKALEGLVRLPGENFQKWLERALQHLDAEKRVEDQAAKKNRATTQTLSQQIASTPIINEPVTEIEAKLKEARVTLESKRVAKADADAAIKAHANSSNRILAYTMENEKLRAAAYAIITLEATITALEKQLEKLGVSNSFELTNKRTDADAAFRETKTALTAINKALAALDVEEAKVMTHKTCPTCNANKPTWRKNAQAKFDERRAEMKESQTNLDALLGVRAAEFEAAKLESSKATERDGQRTVAERELKDAKSDLAAAYGAANRIEANNAAIKELEAEGGGAAADGQRQNNAANADVEYQDMLEIVTGLEKKYQSAISARADAKMLEQAAVERDNAQFNAKELQGGLSILETARAQFMAKGFEPLLKVANRFTNKVLPTPLEYRNGELGRMEKSRFIPTRMFSGSEQVATHAAISAALGCQSGMRLVIIDELTRMMPLNKRNFMENILLAIPNDSKLEPTIHQFIGVDTDATEYIRLNADYNNPINLINIGG